jgi:hypothetical protein
MFNKIVNKARSYFSTSGLRGPRIRNTSPSLGRLFRERGVMVHMSTRTVMVNDKDGIPQIRQGKGITLNTGRNEAKRAARSVGFKGIKDAAYQRLLSEAA